MSERPHAPRPDVTLGLDVGGSKIAAVLLDRSGREHWRTRIATPAGDYAATLDAIAGLVDQARQVASGAVPIGIGTPGATDGRGLIKNANSTCLNGRPLQADLAARLGQAVVLANDANCLALSEAQDGAAAGADVVFAVILGTGVGAGLAVQGRVLQGPNGLAGEWGHNPLPWPTDDERPGPRCYCGAWGCTEAWLSGPALAADHRRHGGVLDEAIAIAAAAAQGDGACGATLRRHAERLGRALAMVVNLLDPDVVVLAGGVSQLPGLAEALPAQVSPWVFGAALDPPLRTRFVRARHGDDSGVRGAAWLAWRAAPPGARAGG